MSMQPEDLRHRVSQSDFNSTTSTQLITEDFILELCAREDLRTFDPYDIWVTPVGFRVKNFYNHHRYIGLPGAVALTAFDLALGEKRSFVYRPREYPIVRAWAALILLEVYEHRGGDTLLGWIRSHLKWLRQNSCRGFSGPCWGLGFRYAVGRNLVYDENTPLATMTPYALEAFCRYTEITGDDCFRDTIMGVYRFFENDIAVMEETDQYLVTSYAPFKDRRVVNAVSYTLFSYALFLKYLQPVQQLRAQAKMAKLYAFIQDQQRPNGSWFYSPDGSLFIDCFHSCIVLKNLIKASGVIDFDNSNSVIHSGFEYIKQEFLCADGLPRRFSVRNKPGVVRYDLYDSAELLSLGHLIGDHELVTCLAERVEEEFVRGRVIYSQIDVFGRRHNRNMLRWAVMPYMHALAQIRCSIVG